MAIENYRSDMEMCHRCSACKFIPLERIRGYDHAGACPSIGRYNFHSYSGGGRVAMGLALLDGRFGYTKQFLDVVYNCQMCGACDVSCKYGMDMEVLEPLTELRIRCVEDGHPNPAAGEMMKNLRGQGTMTAGARARRGRWAEGLGVKDSTVEKTKVLYYAGCRTSFDRELWKVARSTISVLQKAGVNVGIAGTKEPCCGGRAYYMGYREDLIRQAKANIEMFEQSGAETVVTGCSECYHAFKVLYEKFGVGATVEVLHSTQYFDRLLNQGKLRPSRKVAAKVTYHDPCHLGRLGEPYVPWQGTRVPGHMYRFDPPKPYRRGTYGVYEPPRDVLRAIPGIELVEMDRTREYAWCCGSGGGVKETNPQFALWTAMERIDEAMAIGAEGIVTACPGCERNFGDAIRSNREVLPVYDVVELLEKAI
ncbi:MAG: (Fe-S)-binding protein [Thermodesulfobacteriota bacterium]